MAGAIVPIEVKAGKSGTLKSLHQFVRKTGVTRAVRFDLNQPSVQTVESEGVTFELLSLPLYWAGRVHDLLRTASPVTTRSGPRSPEPWPGP